MPEMRTSIRNLSHYVKKRKPGVSRKKMLKMKSKHTEMEK